jgi:hypothetical protein
VIVLFSIKSRQVVRGNRKGVKPAPHKDVKWPHNTAQRCVLGLPALVRSGRVLFTAVNPSRGAIPGIADLSEDARSSDGVAFYY